MQVCLTILMIKMKSSSIIFKRKQLGESELEKRRYPFLGFVSEAFMKI